MTSPLAGKGVLLTRPAGQAGRIATRLAELGAEAVLFPAIAIAPPSDPAPSQALIEAIASFDLAIFISPTAAETGLTLIRAQTTFPAELRAAAIGEGTARTLTRLGLANVIVPERNADSESLLALPELLAVAGQRIVIFRGEGGRALLADTLRARGAEVEYANCYRRTCPAADPTPILKRWAAGRIDATVVTSREGLDNLFTLLGETGAACLRNTPMFVPHERIAAAAHALGVHNAIATPPGDEGLLAALGTWFDHERNRHP